MAMQRTLSRGLAAVLIVGLGLLGISRAQDGGETREHAVLTTIGKMLPEGHLSQHPLDDSDLEARARRSRQGPGPVEALLPAVRRRVSRAVTGPARRHDAPGRRQLREERLGAAREASRGARGLGARVPRVGSHFDKDEFWVTDTKQVDFAATPAEARDRWRRRVKYDLLMLEGPDLPREKAIEKLSGRYDRLLSRMKGMDPFDWLAAFVNAVTTAYDPHTTWLTPKEMEDFAIAMRLNFEGIGAQLRDDDGYITISSLMPGGAAIKDGRLQAGDRILSVGAGPERSLEGRGRAAGHRRRGPDPRPGGHDRAAPRQAEERRRDAHACARAPEDAARGQRGTGRGPRGERRRRRDRQDRRHQPAGVLPRRRRGRAGQEGLPQRGPRRRAHPLRLPKAGSGRRRARPALQRRRLSQRGDRPHRVVHRRRTRRARARLQRLGARSRPTSTAAWPGADLSSS